MRKHLPWIPKDAALNQPKQAGKVEHCVALNSTRPMRVARSRFTHQVEIDQRQIAYGHTVIKKIEHQICLDSLPRRKSCHYNFRKLYLVADRNQVVLDGNCLDRPAKA